MAFVYKQDFFNTLYEELGIALENIVYYKVIILVLQYYRLCFCFKFTVTCYVIRRFDNLQDESYTLHTVLQNEINYFIMHCLKSHFSRQTVSYSNVTLSITDMFEDHKEKVSLINH